MITLPEKREAPLYQVLYDAIKEQIQTGRYGVGARLPSKRKLADELKISVNTVDSAYSQLEAEGFIQSSPRRGFFVLDTGNLPAVRKKDCDTQRPEIIQQEKRFSVRFSPWGMARAQFPYGTWRRLMGKCFNEYDEALLLRTPSQGDYGLRAVVADYLYRARGVNCTPEQLVIGAGTDNLLMILSYILPAEMTLVTENPIYNQADRLFSRMGHPVASVTVGAQGIQISELPSLDQVAVYTTPSHQYPLGFAMPIGLRTALLGWSAGGGERYIIEDDYDSEFRYQTRPIPSLQSIDHLGRVIYMGTFSRSVAPALRISYMVLPEPILARYRETYGGFSSTVSGFEQAVLRQFMLEGHFETHVNRMRIYYRARRQCLVDALGPLAPWMEILGQPAGHHLTLKIKNGMDEKQLLKSAERAGIEVFPVSPYFRGAVPEEYRSTVLLGFGGLDDDAICRGAACLVAAWKPE